MEKDENWKWFESKLKELGFGKIPNPHKVNILGKDFILDGGPFHINMIDRKITVTPLYVQQGFINALKYALMIEGQIGELNEKTLKSIDRISKVLRGKGFNRPFHMNGYGTDLLPDLLRKYFHLALKDPMKLNIPLVVSTYSHFDKDDSRYVKCSFTINIEEKKGLVVTRMQTVSCGMDHTVLEHWEKPIKDVADILHQQQANRKVMEVDNKKKKHKGYKR